MALKQYRIVAGVALSLLFTPGFSCVRSVATAFEPEPPTPQKAADTEPADAPVIFTPKFQVGQQAVYEVSTKKQESKGNRKPKAPRTSTSRVTVKVLQVEPTIVLAWDTGKPNLEQLSLPDDPKAKEMTEAVLKGALAIPPIEIEMTDGGELVGMRNWEQVRGPMKEATLKVVGIVVGKDDPKKLEFMTTFVENYYSDEGTGQDALLRDAWGCFMGLGYVVPEDGERVEDAPFENNVRDEPIPATMTIKRRVQDSALKKTPMITLDVVQKTTPEAAEVMRRNVVELGGKASEGDPVEFSMEDRSSYSYDTELGWMIRTTWMRRLHAGDVRRTEERTYVLVEGPSMPAKP